MDTWSGQQYNLDISADSRWRVVTPALPVQRLPAYLLEWGLFRAGARYYTDRPEGIPLYLLFYTLSGQGRLTCGGREYRLEKDTLLLLDGRVPHRYRAEGSWTFLWAQFGGDGVDAYASLLNTDGLRLLSVAEDPVCRTLMEGLEAYAMGQDLGVQVACSATLIRLLSLMVMSALSEQKLQAAPVSRRILDAVRYMDAHYAEKLTMEQVAKTAYLSKYHFLRVFHQHMGVSPYEYLTSVRISKAKELLNTSGEGLDAIAAQVGFADGKGLIRRFRQLTGMTPSQYRRLSANR